MDPPMPMRDLEAKVQEAKLNGALELIEESVLEPVVKEIMRAVLKEKTIISLALFVGDSQGVDHIAHALVEAKNLKKLKIIGDNIDKRSMLLLAEAVRKCSSVNELIISFYNLDNEALSDFATALQTNMQIYSASFEGSFNLIGIRDFALAFRNFAMAPNNLGKVILKTTLMLPENYETTLPEVFYKEILEGNELILSKYVKRRSNGYATKRLKNIVNNKSGISPSK
jgi:hypothetical protein